MITLQELHERDNRPPSVTVYMICYNHEKYIDEAMHGVLMQKTNFPVNIVIHDDASPDRSGEIIRKYAAENPNITAIIEETNYYQNGKSFLPKVIPHFTGKYIACCECDDFWIDEHKLQKQVDYLESNPDCVAVYSNVLPVNKYGKYDESTRKLFQKTGEGDYPKGYIYGIKHQLASCLIRNLWQFMTSEEIDSYIDIKANGDEKLLVLLINIGRVHYFSDELAAYRSVYDEGTSYSARMAKTGKYEQFCCYVKRITEVYRMIEHFFGKKYRRKYVYVLCQEFRLRLQFHRSVIKDAELDSCYHLKNMPLYAWLAAPFYLSYEAIKRTIKALLRRKF